MTVCCTGYRSEIRLLVIVIALLHKVVLVDKSARVIVSNSFAVAFSLSRFNITLPQMLLCLESLVYQSPFISSSLEC
jgi:hypothetical protein